MRARNLKPGFFKNEQLAKLPFEARLLFIGLWCLADREGRLENRPERIKAEVFPYDRVNIAKLLDVITSRGMTLHYTANENQYIQVVNFKKHQSPHPHEAKSSLPPCFEHVTLNPDVRNPYSLNPDIGAKARVSVFSKPSAQDVTAYGASIGFKIDGSAFCDFYESKGWKVGQTPMKSWQATVRTWRHRDAKEAVGLKTPPLPPPPVYDDIPDSERMTEDEMKKIREMAMGGINARSKSI